MGVDCGLVAIELAHVIDVFVQHFYKHIAITDPEFVFHV